MGQSNYNKAAIRAKENGAGEKGKLETGYKAVLAIIGVALVAFLVFGVLVSTHVITCTNTSTLLAEGINGDRMYMTSVLNSDNTGYEYRYYVLDENGKYIPCHMSVSYSDVCYYDENGDEQIYMIEAGEVGDSIDGKTLYLAFSANGMYGYGAVDYYFYDENGNKVYCELSEHNSQLFYTDSEGNKQEFIFASATSDSDVSGSDVSSADAE